MTMTALPSFKQLQYLVALCDYRNFTRAAQACFVTQSTLSAGLRELEGLLGVKLVERDRQTVVMTQVGLATVSRARTLLAAARDLVEVATGAGEPMSGLLRLGVIPTIAPFVLPAALQALQKRYPKLQLGLREDLTANLLDRVSGGELDFALIALPYDTGSLHVEPLFNDDLWLVGRKDAPELQAKQMRIGAMLNKRLLLLEEGHCLREHALAACKPSSRRSTKGLEATSLLTLVQMIESGLGIGLIPEMAIRSGLVTSPKLLTRAITHPTLKRTIALVARRSTARENELHALADVMREVAAAGSDPTRHRLARH